MVFGVEGGIQIQNIVPLFEWMKARGMDGFRLRLPVSEFWNKTWTTDADFALTDKVVNEAEARGITVVIDPAHNFPYSVYITATNSEAWKLRISRIALRYNSRSNVQIQPMNENAPASGNGANEPLFNGVIAYCRNAGVKLPIVCTFFKTPLSYKLTDSLGKTVYDQHDYMNKNGYDTEGGVPALSLDAYLNAHLRIRDGIDAQFSSGFVSQARGFGPVSYTELGPTWLESKVMDPQIGCLAAAMYFIRKAKASGVSVFCYMIHADADFNTAIRKLTRYEKLALDYFHDDYWGRPPVPVPPEPVKPACMLVAFGMTPMALQFFRSIRDTVLPVGLSKVYYSLSYRVLRNRGSYCLRRYL
jgi:hypothetical protein